MASYVWPAELPQAFLQSGFSETLTPNVIQSDLEIGAPQSRPRSTWQGKTYSGSMRINYTQKVAFNNFYQFTTLSGTQVFEFPDPFVPDTVIEVKFDGTNPPSASHWGGEYFTLTMTIILQPYTEQ